MTIAEAKEKYSGQYVACEVYRYTGKVHRVHTDFIEDADDFTPDTEADYVELMNEDDYNSTIYANGCLSFSDVFNPDDRVLVIVIEEA